MVGYMKFSIGFLKSEHQVDIKTFDIKNKEVSQKTIDREDLKEENLQLLFYAGELEGQDALNSLAHLSKFYTFFNASNLKLSLELFNRLSIEEGQNLVFQLQGKVLLRNNLNTLSEIFELSDHLKKLWVNDRYAFFHEVWFLLRTNLGCPELKILFHDVETKESKDQETQKHKLIFSVLDADIKANISPMKGPEEVIFKNYETKFSGPFNLVEYFPEKNEACILCMIDRSPIIIMAKVIELNIIQETILKTLFKSLERK